MSEVKKYKESVTQVAEPFVHYHTQEETYNKKNTPKELNKNKPPKANEMELIHLSRTGLPKTAFTNLAQQLRISMEALSSLLHISHRTFQRKSDTDVLGVHVSEQALVISEVVAKAEEVLGTEELSQKWIHSEIAALNFKKPIDLLDTSFGARLILKTLGRLEHGIY